MRKRIAVFCLVLMMSLAEAVAAQTPTQSGPITAVKAGRLIDPETGTVTTNQVILIQGEGRKLRRLCLIVM